MIRLKDMLIEGMTPMVADTIFAKFGVKNASSLDKGELKKYFIALVKRHHPDVGGSNDEMRYINAAYDVLKTPKPPIINDPEDPGAGRTVPKNKKKARLQKVSVQFRFEDETVIARGNSDYFDLIKIYQHLKMLRITVNFDPPTPYDEVKEQWNTKTVMIYVRSNIRSREYMINVIHGVCETYY